MGESDEISNKIPSWQARFFAYSVAISDQIKLYLSKKKMSTDDMADKIGFTKTKSKQMLSGNYNFSVEEMAKLELLFSGHYDIYDRKLLIEKKSRKKDSSL